jgi:hypothetical protein
MKFRSPGLHPLQVEKDVSYNEGRRYASRMLSLTTTDRKESLGFWILHRTHAEAKYMARVEICKRLGYRLQAENR